MEVLSLRESDKEVNLDQAFEAAASKYPVGKKLIEKWYYEYINQYPITETLTNTGVIKTKTGKPL